MEKPQWIESFADSSYQLFTNHDPASHLPFDAWGLQPYYNDLWLEKLYVLVTKLREKGDSIERYLPYCPNLSSLRFQVLMNTIHYQTSGMDRPEVITTIQDFLVDAICAQAKEDLFAKTSNVSMGQMELEACLRGRELTITSPEEAREIGKCLVALASLTHGLYNDWCTDYDYEISGPYTHECETVLIRSFPDTAPKDLWPEIDWDYRDFSIVTTYKNLEARIAFVGCHITYSDNAVDHLSRYSFRVNGEEIKGLKALRALRDQLMPIAAKQYEKYLGMDFEDQKVMYVRQEHYQYKKLFELVGMEWEPSEAVLDKIRGKELLKDVFPSYEMTPDAYKENFGINKLIGAYNLL